MKHSSKLYSKIRYFLFAIASTCLLSIFAGCEKQNAFSGFYTNGNHAYEFRPDGSVLTHRRNIPSAETKGTYEHHGQFLNVKLANGSETVFTLINGDATLMVSDGGRADTYERSDPALFINKPSPTTVQGNETRF